MQTKTPRTDAAEEVAALSPHCSCRHVDRDEMAKLETELDLEKAKCARLREALEYLIQKADDSDDGMHGTLSTSFVRDVCSKAIAKAKGIQS